MAEINIEKKNGNGKTWLWVILALVAAALLYWWFAADDDDELEEVETVEIENESVLKDDSKTAFWEREVYNT